jgi:hypothetical protein
MKTMRKTLFAFATTTALGLGAPCYAQVLGGQVIGGVGGTLSGGLGSPIGSIGSSIGGDMAASASGGLDEIGSARDRTQRTGNGAAGRAQQAHHAVDTSAATDASASIAGTLSGVTDGAVDATGSAAAAAQTAGVDAADSGVTNAAGASKPAGESKPAGASKPASAVKRADDTNPPRGAEPHNRDSQPPKPMRLDGNGTATGSSSAGIDGQSASAGGSFDASVGGSASAGAQ